MMSTKKCPYCKKMVPEGDQVCPFCKGLLLYCSQCGALMQMGQKECSECHFRVFWVEETERCARCGAPMQFHPSQLCPTCRKKYTQCSKCGKICEISKDGCCAECRSKDTETRRWILIVPVALAVVVITVVLFVFVWRTLFRNGSEGGNATDSIDVVTSSAAASDVAETSVQDAENPAQESQAADQSEPIQIPEETVEKKPEIPECTGYTYSTVSSRLQSLDADPILTYEYSSTINRGCVISAQWEGDDLEVVVSKGLEHSFYSMWKENGDGSIDYIDLYLVDQDGLHSKAYKYDGGGKLTYTFEFDYEELAETAQYFYDSGGAYHHHWEFEYDKHGRIRKEFKFDGSGKEINRTEFEYDSDGRIAQKTDYVNGDLVYRWKMTDYNDHASPCSYCAHVYGNWTRAEIYDAKGNKIRYAVQEFDSFGAVECLAINSRDGGLIYKYVFESSDVDTINANTEQALDQLGN